MHAGSATFESMRVVLIGWGAIGRAVGRLLDEAGIDVVGVATREPRPRTDLATGAAHITRPDALAALRPDVVAEAAGRDSVAPWGQATLETSADFVVSSVSAFADAALLASLKELARRNGAQVQIQPGALGGVDALAAARLMGIDEVEHRIVKPPRAWLGTRAESLCELDALDVATPFFEASAAETASQFPKNANVAMTTALAGVGPDATKVTLVADPAATTNTHQVRAHGAFGQLDVSISNNPLPDNPKTSAMAALNLARSIINRQSAISI